MTAIASKYGIYIEIKCDAAITVKIDVTFKKNWHTHTRARKHARTRTHAHTHARARTHTHTHTHHTHTHGKTEKSKRVLGLEIPLQCSTFYIIIQGVYFFYSKLETN